MTTTQSYIADGSTSSFSVTFPFLSSADLDVRVNNTNVSWTYNSTTQKVDLVDTPANGAQVVISRQTDVTSPDVTFTSPANLTADNLNSAVLQPLYRLEELDIEIAALTLGTASTLPGTTQAGDWLYSVSDGSGGYLWSSVTTAQAQSILGVNASTANSVPDASASFKVLAAEGSTYSLVDPADLRTQLGFQLRQLPTTPPSGSNQFISSVLQSDGQYDWALVTAASVRAGLGLGSAAQLNAGTTANTLVQLDSSGRLPALDASLLTNVPTPTTTGAGSRHIVNDEAPINVDGPVETSTSYTALMVQVVWKPDDSSSSSATGVLILNSDKQTDDFEIDLTEFSLVGTVNINFDISGGTATQFVYRITGTEVATQNVQITYIAIP